MQVAVAQEEAISRGIVRAVLYGMLVDGRLLVGFVDSGLTPQIAAPICSLLLAKSATG
jgi:hypothetical protein